MLVNKIILVFISLIFFVPIKSQGIPESNKKENKYIVRIHALPTGVSVERSLSEDAAMMFDIGAGYLYLTYQYYGGRYSDFIIMPYVAVEPRLYTNMNSRKEKGKRIDYRSGIYTSLRFQAGIVSGIDDWYAQLGPLVGFQRTLGKRWYWNIGAGPAVILYHNNTGLGLYGDLNFGFIIH